MGRSKYTEEEKRAMTIARKQRHRDKKKAEKAAIKEAKRQGLPFDENR